MTTISARVIADSISPQGIRLTSLQLRYPWIIHPELMTHRRFSRSASSGRAVPARRMIDDVERDPFVPLHWGKNQAGMQAHEELQGHERTIAWQEWMRGLEYAVRTARNLADVKAHKQIVNRVLLPYAHINTLVTATEYENFFGLRDHPDAEPHIRELARVMRKAMNESEPTPLRPGQWHLPYVDAQIQDDGEQSYEIRLTHPDDEVQGSTFVSLEKAQKISVARCARNSYYTHDGKIPTIEQDIALYERLVGSQPLHASPAEHIATPDREVTPEATGPELDWLRWAQPELHGNFHGWVQYRKTLPAEDLGRL